MLKKQENLANYRHTNKKTIIIIASLLVLIWISYLNATPEFSVLTGNRCSSCHLNFQGGGMRKEFGWNFGKDFTVLTPSEAGLEGFYNFFDKKKYTLLDRFLAVGTDFRYQTTRSHKYEDAKRKYYPMQASLYINSDPFDWLRLDGQYNFGKLVFPGQQEWAASAYFQPFVDGPILRIGNFQPSIGLRDCDMTMLDRRIPTPDGSQTIIPPDYAEIGAELIYENPKWFSLFAGIFDSKNLWANAFFGRETKIVSILHNPSFTFKFIVYPQWIDDYPPSLIGSSILINGNLIFLNSFLGFSVTDDFIFSFRFSLLNKPYERYSYSIIPSLTYIAYKGILLGIRAEYGKADIITPNKEIIPISTYQMVANAKILLIPYIEFIPEYRFIASEEYKSFRWSLQIHIYY